MSKIEQFSRLINHRVTTAGQLFTIPTSNDHTDETWLASDLYIGEVGINVTDDKVFMRTNNGIIQIATGTSSGSSTASASPFVFNSPNIVIGTTYSADAVTRRSGYFTDLGSSTLRWKDLYLGGEASGFATIYANAGLHIKSTSTNGVITTDGIASTNAPIEINTSSSNVNKNLPLFLNTRAGNASGSTNYVSSVSVNTVSFTNNTHVLAAAGTSITFDDSISYSTHLGRGLARPVYESDMHVVSGKSAVKGMVDDGTGQYDKSEWITSQTLLRTSDALFTDLVTIPWSATATGGDIISIKANILCTVIDDPSYVFAADLFGTGALLGDLSSVIIGTPVVNINSSFPGTQPDVEVAVDANNIYIKAKGQSSVTVQWLCSFSYHRLINVL